MTTSLAALAEALAACGLVLRGGFHPSTKDGLPPLADGPAATLLLVGSVGRDFWSRMRQSPEAEGKNPLDRYTRRVVTGLAGQFGAKALFPFEGPPYHPFQRWARRAEPRLATSPLNMLIHPVYGMWHAYRAALLLAEEIPLAPAAELDHPCHTCVAKPCLTACPAAALSEEGYDVASCRRQLVSASEPACLKHGCLARWACPIGVAYAQDDEQAAYHARVFAGQRAVLSDRSACRD